MPFGQFATQGGEHENERMIVPVKTIKGMHGGGAMEMEKTSKGWMVWEREARWVFMEAGSWARKEV